MSDVSDDFSAHERRVNQILADYLLSLESGEGPDEASWLQQHAEFAAELREFFADKRHMDEIVRRSIRATLWK